MRQLVDFALGHGARRGDSAFLLNQSRHRLAFDSFPGRHIALAFPGSAVGSAAEAQLAALEAQARTLDARTAALFVVLAASTIDLSLERRFPSIVFLRDGDEMARAFGADGRLIVLDPMQRVIDVALLDQSESALARLRALSAPDTASASSAPAPVLALANIFEPELCAHLVETFEQGGARESGFMQDEQGRSIENFDTSWKRRRDFNLADPELIANLRARIGRRICPEIKKAYQAQATRVERDLVACYDSETGGHFGPHRDDTGLPVAHRQFAVSINLNAAFEGGEISFPEYSAQTFKPAPGAAIVFSASILHQVSKVTRGRRYVFLTFLFNEEGERVRQANLRAMQEGRRQPQLAAGASSRGHEAGPGGGSRPALSVS